MKIAMIGCGKLGYPCALEMQKAGHDVIGVDPYRTLQDTDFPVYSSITENLRDRDIIFIAVPTPHDKEYGGNTPTTHLPPKDFDYSIVQQVLLELRNVCRPDQIVVLISTVLPSTNRQILKSNTLPFKYVYNPYLIAMGSVEWDMVNPEMVIIGTKDGERSPEAKVLVDFYTTIMQNFPRYVVGTWEEAEAIKIYYNTFISTKIALVNMIQDTANAIPNMNVDVVTKALAESTMRISSKAYMKAGMGDGGACLHPKTLIYSDRGIVEIKDIVVGDSVIGEDGKFHKVERVWINKHSQSGSKYNGNLVEVKTTSQTRALFTPDHEVYTSNDTRKRYITGGKIRYTNSKKYHPSDMVSDISKTKISDLVANDMYMVSPITIDSCEAPEYATDAYIELAGYYLSEGTCERKNKGNTTYSRISFHLHRKERDTLAERIEFLIKELYPVRKNKITIAFRGNNGLYVRFNCPELAERLVKDFGHGCYYKKLPNWILYSDRYLILRGLFKGDGTSNKSGFALSTTSKVLAIGISSLLKRAGIITSVQEHPPRVSLKGQKHAASYEVRCRNAVYIEKLAAIIDMPIKHKLQAKRYNDTLFSVNGNTYHRIKTLTSVPYTGDVYDLQVADVHNYLTEAGLVSNCHPRDNIALSYLSKKLNLNYDFFRSINHTREQQAKNVARFMVQQAIDHNRPYADFYIHGRAYKPNVSYTDGSYSELIGHYIEELTGRRPIYVDPLTGDHVEKMDGVILLAHHAPTTYSHAKVIGSSSQKFYANIVNGSIIIDMWRYITPDDIPMGCHLIHYGNIK